MLYHIKYNLLQLKENNLETQGMSFWFDTYISVLRYIFADWKPGKKTIEFCSFGKNLQQERETNGHWALIWGKREKKKLKIMRKNSAYIFCNFSLWIFRVTKKKKIKKMIKNCMFLTIRLSCWGMSFFGYKSNQRLAWNVVSIHISRGPPGGHAWACKSSFNWAR